MDRAELEKQIRKAADNCGYLITCLITQHQVCMIRTVFNINEAGTL
jgi:hypothetical protein